MPGPSPQCFHPPQLTLEGSRPTNYRCLVISPSMPRVVAGLPPCPLSALRGADLVYTACSPHGHLEAAAYFGYKMWFLFTANVKRQEKSVA